MASPTGKSNWQVQRDHCHSGTAGPTCLAEQHRDVGCDGLPDRDRRADPGARRRLSADAQGGTVNLIGSGRDKAHDAAMHTNAYARAATLVTSAQVWKAWVRAARYWAAGR